MASIEQLTFEDSLKYLEIPEFLIKLKQRLGSSKKNLEKISEERPVGGEKIENELAEKVEPKQSRSAQDIFHQYVELKKRVKSLSEASSKPTPSSNFSHSLTEEEASDILELSEDECIDLYKIDMQIKEKSYVIIMKADRSLNYR